ncbi:MAG: carboxypeptidase regulatory-like domain-containing protein [Candidatus Yanofskybacteria bacterium]|nr:carboxypeptidase regulatory-like domain-containing protein [Candidatus Yanofskybacteria bacterium]
MTRKTRKLIFYLSVLVFLLMGTLILSFAFGFRYDFQNNRLIKTGSIVIKTNVSAKIYVDDKLEGETSFFSGTFSKKNLLPGKYSLKIQKNGYQTWQKSVMVEEGLISYFGNVFLPLNEPKEETLASREILDEYLESLKLKVEVPAIFDLPEKGVVGFSVFSGESAVVWATNHEIWILWSRNTDYQPIRKAGEKELVTRLSGNIKSVYWHKSGGYVFLRLGTKFIMLETDVRGGVNTYTLYDNLGVKDIVWYDSGLDKIFKYQNSNLPTGQAGLFAVDL